MRAITASAFLAAAALGGPALAEDGFAGEWLVSMSMGQGPGMSVPLTVTEADGGYAIEFGQPQMPGGGPGGPGGGPGGPGGPPQIEISDVSVDGDSFSFVQSMTTPQGAMTMNWSGTIDGDSLAGEVASDFGDTPFTGERQ